MKHINKIPNKLTGIDYEANVSFTNCEILFKCAIKDKEDLLHFNIVKMNMDIE
jgi:hypothetical protein